MTRTIKVGFNSDFDSPIEGIFLDQFRANDAGSYASTPSVGRIDLSRMNLDSNSYPVNMTVINPSTGAVMSYIECPIRQGQNYRAGNYVVFWTGSALSSNFIFTGTGMGIPYDVSTLVSYSSTPTGGRAVINIVSSQVQVSGNGMAIGLVNVSSSAATVTDLHCVYGDKINSSDTQATAGVGGSTIAGTNGTGTYEALFNGGQTVSPDFYTKFVNSSAHRFSVWRTMQHWKTNDAAQPTTYSAWQIPPGNIYWTGRIPISAEVGICNDMGFDLWLSMPPLVDYAGWEQLVNDVHAGVTDGHGKVWPGLNSNLKIYTEFANEIWISASYPWSATAISRANEMWPALSTATSTQGISDFSRQGAYGKTMGVQVGKLTKAIWATNYGDSSRVISVACGNLATPAAWLQATDNDILTGFGPYAGLRFSGNCHISGTTLTIDSCSSGTPWQFQEVRGSGVLDATYIASSAAPWSVNRSQTVGSSSSPVAMTGQFFYGQIANNVDAGECAPYVNMDRVVPTTSTGVTDSCLNELNSIIGYINGSTLVFTSNPNVLTLAPTIQLFQVYSSVTVTSGTYIVSQQTESAGGDWGKLGTYTINNPHTMFSSAAPDIIGIRYGTVWSQIGNMHFCNKGALVNFNVPYLSYEGGYSFIAGASSQQDLYVNWQNSSAGYDAYYNYYLPGIEAASTSSASVFARPAFVHYATVRSPVAYPNWQAIDTVTTSTSNANANKYNALVDFMADTSTGSTGGSTTSTASGPGNIFSFGHHGHGGGHKKVEVAHYLYDNSWKKGLGVF